jgi:hypothetical protein
MTTSPWFLNAKRTARDLCDSNLFRVGVALLLGLPFAALAVMGAVVGGASLYGVAAGLASGQARAEDIGVMLTMVAVFGGVALAFLGIVLRLLLPSAKLAERPGLRRLILWVLGPPLAGLLLMTIVLPQPFTLVGLGLVGVCWLGSLEADDRSS